MGLFHELSVEAFGIGGRKFLKRMIGLNPRPKAYKQYINIMTDYQKRMNQTSCTKIDICKTYEEIAEKHGFQRETLETLQNVEFMEKFHKFLASKGYELPKELVFMEYRIPSESGLLGETFNHKQIIYNPRSIKIMDFRVPIHETGHLMHKEGSLGSMAKDAWREDFGGLMHKLGLFKNCTFNHLNKSEQEILARDLERAWKGGFFKYNPIKASMEERLLFCKTEAEKVKLKKQLNKQTKDFRKNAAKCYIENMLFNRTEFIADYFHLAARGFKFSPEIAAKYEKYGGPKIKELITEDELQKLEQLRKSISKKTFADYGYTMDS